MRPSALTALALLGAAACGGGPPRYTPALQTQACVEPQPFAGVTHVRYRLTAPGGQVLQDDTRAVGTPLTELAGVTAGPGRVLEVRGYAGAPAVGGLLVALGRTPPFEVPRAGEGTVPLHVVMRRVDTPTPPSAPDAPGTCATPLAARAGHSATALPDGRVLLAGGWAQDADGRRVTLASAEVYAPDTARFAPAPGLTAGQGGASADEALPRAHHSATLLVDGRVLLAGGEAEAGALASALVYDPEGGAGRALTLAHARTRHAAVAWADGRVLLGGGEGLEGVAVPLEGLDVASGAALPVVDAPPARAGAGLAGLPGADAAVLAGGVEVDGVLAAPLVTVRRSPGGGFTAQVGPAALRDPRRDAALAPLAHGGAAGVLVAGGYRSALPDAPVGAAELLVGDPPAAAEGATLFPRGEPCAVALPDGRVLVAGGRARSETTPGLRADGLVEVVGRTAAGRPLMLGLAPLPVPRVHHTCTLLPDGAVLVVGGLDEGRFDAEGGALAPAVLADAWVVMPSPLEP